MPAAVRGATAGPVVAKPLRLYLAGPVSNYPAHPAAFNRAKALVTLAGHEPISPLDLFSGSDWTAAMAADLPALVQADGIVMLPGWPQSKGACLELNVALACGKRIFMIVQGGLFETTGPRDGFTDLTAGKRTSVAPTAAASAREGHGKA